MTEAWFDPSTFGSYYGAIGGSACGVLGGLLGGLGGYLAPRGRGRRFILSFMIALVLVGISQFAFGVIALLCGQPYGIWYPPLLLGAIMTVVVGGLIPVMRQRYREAERRRIEAEGLRSS